MSYSLGCPIGSYGLHCSQPCQCKNGSNCSAVTGECTCASGFKGTDCSEGDLTQCVRATSYTVSLLVVCPTWTYGRMCENQCSCYRNGSSHCHHVTGDCTCLEKWNGTFCNKGNTSRARFKVNWCMCILHKGCLFLFQ